MRLWWQPSDSLAWPLRKRHCTSELPEHWSQLCLKWQINLPSSAWSNASTLTSDTALPAASPMSTSPTTTPTPMVATSPVTKAGHPKGSSAVQKRQALITFRECIDEIVLDYSQELALCKNVGRRVNKRYLKTLIKKKKKQYKVNSEISPGTVRTRARRGLAKSSGRGAKSPLADAEKH